MTKLFVSYSKRDYKWFLKIKEFFRNEITHGFIQVWSDGDIPPGSDFKAAIENAVKNSDAFVVLLSPAYLKSRFGLDIEIPSIMTRVREENLRLFPFQVDKINKESLPKVLMEIKINTKPFSEMKSYEIEKELTKIREAIQGFNIITYNPDHPTFSYPTSGDSFLDAFDIASGVTGGYNEINISGAPNIFTQAEQDQREEEQNDDEK